MFGDGIDKKMLYGFVLFLTVVISPISQAYALGGTLGSVMENTVTSLEMVPGLFTATAYLIGLFLGISGILKVVEHVQNPQQTSYWEFVKRFVAGGALFALPMVFEATKNTLTAGAGTAMHDGPSGWTGATTGLGLDAMMAGLMSDIHGPVQMLLWGFCYLAAIILVIIGILRLLKTAQDGPRGPGGVGTIMTFIVAGALFSVDSILGAFGTSLFVADTMDTQAALQYSAGMTAAEIDHVHAVISAVLAFVMVIGWISFIRGFFIIRDVAEGGQQASLMAGITHLIGGTLAVNLGSLMNAVQETFGLTAFGVVFS